MITNDIQLDNTLRKIASLKQDLLKIASKSQIKVLISDLEEEIADYRYRT